MRYISDVIIVSVIAGTVYSFTNTVTEHLCRCVQSNCC